MTRGESSGGNVRRLAPVQLLETVPTDVVRDVHGLVGAGLAPAAREGAVLAQAPVKVESSGLRDTAIVTVSPWMSHLYGSGSGEKLEYTVEGKVSVSGS